MTNSPESHAEKAPVAPQFTDRTKEAVELRSTGPFGDQGREPGAVVPYGRLGNWNVTNASWGPIG